MPGCYQISIKVCFWSLFTSLFMIKLYTGTIICITRTLMSIFNRIIFLSVLSLTLISCGGSAENPVNTDNDNITHTSGVATLNWLAPDENTDSSLLDNLTGYKIYYGEQSDNLTESINIDGINLTSYVIENLSSNTTYYFSITAINSQNIESAYSNTVSKTIN